MHALIYELATVELGSSVDYVMFNLYDQKDVEKGVLRRFWEKRFLLYGMCHECNGNDWELMPRDGIKIRKRCNCCGAIEWRYEGPRQKGWLPIGKK